MMRVMIRFKMTEMVCQMIGMYTTSKLETNCPHVVRIRWVDCITSLLTRVLRLVQPLAGCSLILGGL